MLTPWDCLSQKQAEKQKGVSFNKPNNLQIDSTNLIFYHNIHFTKTGQQGNALPFSKFPNTNSDFAYTSQTEKNSNTFGHENINN